MYLRHFIYILIFLFIIYYIYQIFYKEIYYFLLKNFITPNSVKRNQYFIDNFHDIISPYYNGDIPVTNKSININRNIKNEYSLNNRILTKDLDLNNPSNETIDILLKRIIPFINIDNKPVSFDDLIVVDVLSTTGSYFPHFHTDVEWRSFSDYDGFQVWILLEDDPSIKPRGNMFIMETDIVAPGLTMEINEKNVNIIKNDYSDQSIKKSYATLNDINPDIKYLNPNIGDVFIMNPSVFHSSDPANIYSKRHAINMRFVHKTSPLLKIREPFNSFSTLLRTKHSCILKNDHIGDYCEFKFNNSTDRYKFI